MIPRTPIGAMLWEHWRLSRLEAAQRFGLGIVAGAGALSLSDSGAFITFYVLMLVHCFFWFSIARLNGGRFMDGYKPGFPLHLLYTRPVPTWQIVGVAMIYDALSCLALYLVSAALLGYAFARTFPLLEVVPWIVAFHLACTCIQWFSRNRVAQWMGSIVIGWPFFVWLNYRVNKQLEVQFTTPENVLMAVICLAAVAIAILGVARQRRGDAVADTPRKNETGGYPDWLVAVFRFRCPTASATRAQVWFELKTSGLPVITIGLLVAVSIAALFALAIPVPLLRHFAIGISFMSIPVALFTLGGNAFGIRRRQGRTYASAFELTQPYGTAGLVGLKVLVRTVCILVAVAAVVVSLRYSSALLYSWGEWLADGRTDALPNLLKAREKVGAFFGGMTGAARIGLAVLVSILVTTIVAWGATREALRVSFPRFQRALAAVILGWAFIVIVLAVAGGAEILSDAVVRQSILGTIWLSGLALIAMTIYLFWQSIAQRALTVGYGLGALAVAAAFGLAWRAAVPVGDAVGIAWFSSMVLAIVVVAPWALGRVRHS